MNVRYRVELDQCERDQLTALLSGGKRGARKLKRAQILLAVIAAPAMRRSPEASASAALPYTGPSAARVERAGILLAYREDPSFFAVGRALGLHHQTVQRCVERAVAEGPAGCAG